MKDIKKTMITLALLITAVTGAWATTVTWTQADLSGINLESGQSTTISGVKLTANNGSVYMDAVPALFFNGNNVEGFTFSVAEGSITQIVITASMFNVSASGWTEGDTQVTWTGNAQSVNFGPLVYDVSSIEFTISGGNSTGVDVNWNKATKTGTFKMPGGNVTLQVEYYPAMLTLAASPADGGSIAVDGLSLGGPKAFDVPAAWSDDETTLSANDLPTDFAAIDDADLPATIAALSSDEVAFLIYGFDGEKTKVVSYVNGTKDDTDAGFIKRYSVSSWIEGGMKIYYTTAPTLPAGFDTDGTNIYVEPKTQFQVKAVPAEGYHLVSLSDGTNTYDVDADGIATVTMPEGDADLTLTATFAETTYAVTFAEGIDLNEWNADPATNVTKGETVTVTYSGTKKVLGVKAEKKAKAATLQTVNITGDTSATLYFLPGETFGQAIANHPENTSFEINGGYITCNGYWLFIGYYDVDVTPDTLVEANGDYRGLLI